MSEIWGKIKGIIGTVAPAVASVIGTPVAGVAVKSLCNLLGLKDDAGPQEIDNALQKASPETWLKIKELNAETEVKLKELDIDAAKIDQMEMESARNREVKLAEAGHRDYTPSLLALALIVGFFGLLATLIFVSVAQAARDTIDVMLGALSAGFMTMLTYYFGSSKNPQGKQR